MYVRPCFQHSYRLTVSLDQGTHTLATLPHAKGVSCVDVGHALVSLPASLCPCLPPCVAACILCVPACLVCLPPVCLLSAQVVGAKACNLAKLRLKLPDWIMVPRSIALPFGTFEAVLTDPANKDVAAQLRAIQQQLSALAAGKSGSSRGGGSRAAGGSDGGSAAAAAAAAVGSNGSSGEASPVALLARARDLVNTQLKAPEGMQQVGDVWRNRECSRGVCRGRRGRSVRAQANWAGSCPKLCAGECGEQASTFSDHQQTRT